MSDSQDKIHAIPISGLFEDWFLEYASYVILERAIPSLSDGLKPVQRRLLHSMKVMDDGRFNKVANIIGSTMQYHPHGDAAIGDAIVNLGQKELLIETQGNWGDTRTGDRAAAPRYIEARLSKFALEVAFNPDTTVWQTSYDGRKQEPVNLPMKFPMALAQGVEGIAVGLSTKILPHNFQELIKASIQVLKGKETNLLPDFPTGGYVDCTDYQGGKRGGKIRVRARIEQIDKKTLAIKTVPYGTTTSSLIDSIIRANDKGKIKIKQVIDNTAQEVELLVTLAPQTSPDVTIDALYAFTDCEISISPNTCVLQDEKPMFMDVNEVLRISTANTKHLLKRELEIKQYELEEKWHFSSLEKIFIENRIYRDIEECETWEAVLEAIDKGLDPFKSLLKRAVTEEDIVRLTEIKIKRISKYDSFKADELIKGLEDQLAEVAHHLNHLTDYAIQYFENLLKKYGKGRERKTEITTFETIQATQVAANNAKLYVNRKDGFVGFGLKKDEFICDCSDLDDVIAFRKDGQFIVSKISDKNFMGKDLIHVDIWKKGDDRMTYNMIYSDPKLGKSFAKRFNVTAITRDKEYDLTAGNPDSKTVYFTANPNAEAEIVTIQLTASSKAKKKAFDFDFGELAIKGRGSRGNTITKYAISKVTQKEKGESSIGGQDIWLDETVGRLNTEERGRHLGSFDTEDLILTLYKSGDYELTNFDLINHYQMDEIVSIQQFDPDAVIAALHYDGEHKRYYLKRFQIETKTLGQRFSFISDRNKSKLLEATLAPNPQIDFEYTTKKGEQKQERIIVNDFIDVKGWKALGNQIGTYEKINKVILTELEPEISEEDDEKIEEQATETTEENTVELSVEPTKNNSEASVELDATNPPPKKEPKPEPPKTNNNEDEPQLGLF